MNELDEQELLRIRKTGKKVFLVVVSVVLILATTILWKDLKHLILSIT